MRITVLTVPDCPNAPLARARITAALAGRDVAVEQIEVRDDEQAAALGMTGSPTIQLDGIDPFAPEGAAPSVSCRLYRAADGTTSGAPSVTDLHRALAEAGLPEPAEGDCCPDGLDAIGRGGRGRRAPAERGLRAVHQAVLRHFADTGAAPDITALESVAGGHGRTASDVLEELAREDFLTLDDQQRIRAAYPFSAVPTRHRVRIAGGAQVWSMCAIDALGIAAMVDRDTVISSTDPVTGEPITVSTTGTATTWEPSGAVVFVGSRPGSGPAAALCCDALNFFAGTASATTWANEHPQVPGRVVDQARAEQIAVQTFGPLLAD